MSFDLKQFGEVIAVLLVLGAILKNAFPAFPNRFIPVVTWIVGVFAYQIIAKGWSDPQQWLAAVMAAASATGIHSGVKNTFEGTDSAKGIVPALILIPLLFIG